MKLVFAIYSYFPYGGLQKDFFRLAQEVLSRGWPLTVLAAEWEGEKPEEFHVEILKTRGEKDARFRVIRGEENRGISGNTNEAVKYARGEYVALCDHDDLLAPDALWRVAKCIAEKHPDMIYTDEDRITENGRKHMDPHYKPDYCPDNLVSDNYICHLAVIRKALLEDIN